MTSIVQEVETGSESDDVFQSPEKHSKSFGSDGDAAQDASDSAHVPPVVKEVAADSSSTNQADPDDDAQREQLINEIIGLQQTLRGKLILFRLVLCVPCKFLDTASYV